MHELFVRKGTKAQQPPGSRIKLDAYFKSQFNGSPSCLADKTCKLAAS